MISKYIGDLNKWEKLDNDNYDIWHSKIQYLLERGLGDLNIINEWIQARAYQSTLLRSWGPSKLMQERLLHMLYKLSNMHNSLIHLFDTILLKKYEMLLERSLVGLLLLRFGCWHWSLILGRNALIVLWNNI